MNAKIIKKEVSSGFSDNAPFYLYVQGLSGWRVIGRYKTLQNAKYVAKRKRLNLTNENKTSVNWILSLSSKKDDDILIEGVDVSKLNRLWKEGDIFFIKENAGETQLSRMGKLKESVFGQGQNPTIDAPVFKYNNTDNAGFIDGRHRFVLTRDILRAPKINIALTKDSNLKEFVKLTGGKVKKRMNEEEVNAAQPIVTPKQVRETAIVIDFNAIKEKEGEIKESFLSMIGSNVKALLNRMFGHGPEVPVKLRGSKNEIDSFYNTLKGEKRYITALRKYGLDDPRAVRSKTELEKRIKQFERATGLKWFFK